MDPQAAFHLAQLAREVLELGADYFEAHREVRILALGDEDLDGREVDCIAISIGDEEGHRQVLAVEACLAEDAGGHYTASLAALLERPA